MAVIALSVQVGWALLQGLRPSTDFRVRYDPFARYLLSTAGLSETPAGEFNASYAWARIGYISVVAVSYALFGESLAAVVVPQIAVTWLIYPLLFHLLLHSTGNLVVSVGAIAVWLSFLDSYQWHFWALPDAYYRLLFVAAAFVLLRLAQTQSHKAFVVVTLVATAVLTTFRIETPLYAAPALVAVAVWAGRDRWWLPVSVVAAGAVLLWSERQFTGEIGRLFVSLFSNGQILPGSGQEIAGVTYLVPPAGGTGGDWAAYYARVFTMRAWHAITPLPALWSRAHQLYYAAYIIPAYCLVIAGLLTGAHRASASFRAFLWIFAAGILLQVLVAVDPSMRYAYTPQVFLFLCAAIGLHTALSVRRGRLSTVSGRVS